MQSQDGRHRKRTLATLIAFVGLLGTAVLVALGACSREPRVISPPNPTAQTPPLAPLPSQPSAFSLSMTASVSSIATAINSGVPTRESGSQDGPAGTDVSWRIDRSPVSVSTHDGSLRLTGSVAGYVRFELDLVLDDLTATFDVEAQYTAHVQPRLAPAWRITPNLSAEVTVTEAEHDVFNLVTISVRSIMQPHIDRAVDREVGKLEARIANDDFIESAARDLWQQLCTSMAINSEQNAWLEIVPKRFRATQPRTASDRFHVQLGLDADTRVSATPTQPICPFPDNLFLEDPESGSTDIWLPIEFGYDELNDVLNQVARNSTIGHDVSLTIDGVTLQPHGSSLLLQVDVSAAAPNWFSRPATGSIFLIAKPQLDTSTSTLTLTDVHLDVESRDVLVEAIGEAAEPLVVSYFDQYTVLDLNPALDQLRNRANDTLAELGNLSPEGMAITAELNSLDLVALDIGPDTVRLVVAAAGTTEVTMDTIEF